MSIAERLREERTRLKLVQMDAAQLGGVNFSTYQGYERGARFPTADTLANLHAAGFDVLYIITGTKNTAELDNVRSTLLAELEQVDEKARNKVLAAVLAMVQAYNNHQ